MDKNVSKTKVKARVKEIFKKLSIVLFGLILALVFMEIFLRIYFKEDYSVPSHRNWKFKKTWEQKYANINSLGYRDHEFNKNKDNDSEIKIPQNQVIPKPFIP